MEEILSKKQREVLEQRTQKIFSNHRNEGITPEDALIRALEALDGDIEDLTEGEYNDIISIIF